MPHSSTIHAAASGSAQEYLDGWKRARAQLANLRTRLDAEATENKTRAKRDLVQDLLSVADNFHALAQHAPEDKASDPWVQGVLHVARQFDQTLADFGVTIINPLGEAFTPTHHEAVEKVEDTDKESGTVVEVLQPGYALGDTVIRPAKVKIAT